jgi:hypothetical protein
LTAAASRATWAFAALVGVIMKTRDLRRGRLDPVFSVYGACRRFLLGI